MHILYNVYYSIPTFYIQILNYEIDIYFAFLEKIAFIITLDCDKKIMLLLLLTLNENI